MAARYYSPADLGDTASIGKCLYYQQKEIRIITIVRAWESYYRFERINTDKNARKIARARSLAENLFVYVITQRKIASGTIYWTVGIHLILL